MDILNSEQYIAEKLNIQPVSKERLDKVSSDLRNESQYEDVHNRDELEFLGLYEESDKNELKKGCTYLLADNMGGDKDKWYVSVFVRDIDEEDSLYDLCWNRGYKRFNGGDSILCFGKSDYKGYAKVVSFDEFKRMFEEEEQGKHTLHQYYIDNVVE